MIVLYIVCGVLYLISFVANKEKTLSAMKSGFKMFMKILPTFLGIILLMTVILFVFTPDKIVSLLSSEYEFLNIIAASLVGSIAVIPGFIAFPVAKILKDIGVGYGVLAAFTTTLMMVGILTYPVEKKYYGKKLTIIRNVASYIIAIIVSLVISIVL